MAIIENKIQYDWVRKKVSKLKMRVDKKTHARSPYRIELELLSKLLEDYYKENPSILEEEKKASTKIIVQECINFDEEIPKLKIKKEVYAELPKLAKLVKKGAIEKEMGVNSGWLSTRLNRSPNGSSVRKFTPSDIDRLNQGIWQLAQKLSKITFTYCEDRTEYVQGIKEALKAFFIAELCLQKLGLEALAVQNRMSTGVIAMYRPRFTQSELERLSLGIRELAVQMLSVEYYLDED